MDSSATRTKQNKIPNPNPFGKANFISRLLFLWLFPFLQKGSKQDLTADDMFDVLDQDEAGRLGDQLESAWEKEKITSKEKQKNPQLLKCIIAIHGKLYSFLSVICIFNECVIKVLQPVLLQWLIQSFYKDSTATTLERYLYATGLCLTTLIYSLLVHGHVFYFTRIGLQCRVALSVMVYRKALRLSKYSLRDTNTGHVVNLLSTDVTRFDWNLFLPYIIAGPLQLAIFAYLLWRELGISTFAGIGIVMVLLPMQFFVFKFSESVRTKISKRTDDRAGFMNEIIVAIRVIKMYAWEKPFSSLIHKLRKLEVNQLTNLAYLQSFYHILFHSSAKIIILLTIVAYTLDGNSLTADKVFFCVAVVNTALHASLFCIPIACSDIGAIMVSMKRLQKYLLLDEFKLNYDEYKNCLVHSKNGVIDIEGSEKAGLAEASVACKSLSASWTREELTLKNLNLELGGNQLVMVVGTVGAGKSSLLNMLISELPVTSGQIAINGRLSYDSQDPWLFSGTIKQNILFGNTYNSTRYNEVVNVCGLEDDLKQFPHGNNTIVGERGVSLSGGQKARLNLARCLYQEADIYLLDDPLSAVDTRVSRYIFEKCIQSYLNGKLRILVTHQLQYLPNADHIIVLQNGEILAQGSYKYLLSRSDVDFVSLTSSTSEENQNEFIRKDSTLSLGKGKGACEMIPEKEPEFLEEQMAGGTITWKTYLEYFKASKSFILTILILFGFVLTQLAVNGSEYWLSYWTQKEDNHASDYALPSEITTLTPIQDIFKHFDRNFYLFIFTGFVAVGTLLGITTTIGFHKYCMRIGVNMHDNMFKSIVRAPTRFFDFNPSGRVMNRFTKDLVTIDEKLPETLYDTTRIFFEMVGVAVIACISNYYILIPTFFIVIALSYTRKFFIGAGRAVKRTEALSRSPLFTHLTASMQGLSTIRSSNSQAILNQQFESYQNTNTESGFLFLATTRWFAIWLELESIVYLIAITFSFFLIPDSTSGGNVGLAISSALVLNLNFQWGMRQSAETENHMTSVERIVEYSAINSEAPLDSNSAYKPSEKWPEFGEIIFKNVSLSYHENENGTNTVLKNLSFEIKAEEKIGIVGRTGAGKSSIIAALFRMTESKGSIYIDGVCINNIGLHDLRENISIIPQDPILFGETARYNLDPFNKFTDSESELWIALEEAHLKDAIHSLDFVVTDGGNNLSVGQRQLVCLARAILRKNRIIIMDEATANVDPKTDELIQKTIRSKFAACTIITIAHRLHSVMDCDKILVLENGFLMEYDHPHTLLQNSKGILSSMVTQLGESGGQLLKSIAFQTFHGRKQKLQRGQTNETEFLDTNENILKS